MREAQEIQAKRNLESQGMDQGSNQYRSRDNRGKRNALRTLLGITVTAAGSKYWMEPVVNSVILPAHAQTTTPELVPEIEPQIEEPTLEKPPLRPPENTPPLGENVVVDAKEQTQVQYSLLPHISDQESPASALSISIASLPASGLLTLIGGAEFSYQLSAQSFAQSDRFEYQVVDPQGLKSPVYTVDLINFPVIPQ